MTDAQLDKLRKLADWLKGWLLVEPLGSNVALQVAIDQLFDPEENGTVLQLLEPNPTSAGHPNG